MDDAQRLQLQKMLDANQAENNTDQIREVKHSQRIREDVQRLIDLKRSHARLAVSNPDQFDQMCVSRCNFLFTHYTDIFNRVKKDELDLNILGRFLDVLKQIEDGKVDQHEASVVVGELLKKLYVDSALRKSEHLDQAAEASKKSSKKSKQLPPKKITWKQFAASQEK